MSTTIKLNSRELAHVLAALRYCQGGLSRRPTDLSAMEHFARSDLAPLGADEIDALCERINVSADTTRATTAPPPHKGLEAESFGWGPGHPAVAAIAKAEGPATCPVALIQDTPDRRVAMLGTDCISEDDCRTLLGTAEAIGDEQCLLWLGRPETTTVNWYTVCGYSERFIAICERFRGQGYDYIWFDRDRETIVGQPGPPAPSPLAKLLREAAEKLDEYSGVLDTLDDGGSADGQDWNEARDGARSLESRLRALLVG